MARRAPGPRLCPSPAARALRGARELLPHYVSTGGTHCLHPWEAGAQAARDTDRLPLSRTPGRLKCPRIRPARHYFKPRRLLCVAGARPVTGGSALPALSRGRRCGDRTACGRQRRKKIKTKQTKNHPQPRGAQLQQRRLFLEQGETRDTGQIGDQRPRRALLQPGRPPLPPGGAGRTPAERAVSRGGILRAGSSQRTVGPPRPRSQPYFDDGFPLPFPFLPPFPLCSPPPRGVWVCMRPQELRPLRPGAVDLSEESPKEEAVCAQAGTLEAF